MPRYSPRGAQVHNTSSSPSTPILFGPATQRIIAGAGIHKDAHLVLHDVSATVPAQDWSRIIKMRIVGCSDHLARCLSAAMAKDAGHTGLATY